MTVELDGYQCRRLKSSPHVGTHALSTYQCRGRMVATSSLVTRQPTVTCDACGRVALAESSGDVPTASGCVSARLTVPPET